MVRVLGAAVMFSILMLSSCPSFAEPVEQVGAFWVWLPPWHEVSGSVDPAGPEETRMKADAPLIPINKAYISVSVRGVNSYHEDKKVDYSVVASEVGIGRDGTVESVKGLAVNKRFDNGDGVAMHVALRSHLLDRCPADMSFLRIKATVKGFGDEVRYKQIFDLLGDTKTMQVAFNMSDAAITRFTAITTIAEKLLQPRYLHPDYPKVLLDVETWIPLGEGGSVPSAMDPLREGFLIAVGTREKDSDFGKLALRGWRDWRINNGTLEYRDESDATKWHSAEKYTYVIYAVTSETSRREDVRSAWFGKYSEAEVAVTRAVEEARNLFTQVTEKTYTDARDRAGGLYAEGTALLCADKRYLPSDHVSLMRTFAAAIGGYLEELRKLVEQRTGSPIEVAWTTERLQAEYQAAAALYEAQIEAQRNAAIVARVLSERGDPLGAVPVTVTSLEDPEQEWRVTTDASGEATFAGLGAGEYLIKHGDKPGGERFILDPKERLSAVIGVGPPAS